MPLLKFKVFTATSKTEVMWLKDFRVTISSRKISNLKTYTISSLILAKNSNKQVWSMCHLKLYRVDCAWNNLNWQAVITATRPSLNWSSTEVPPWSINSGWIATRPNSWATWPAKWTPIDHLSHRTRSPLHKIWSRSHPILPTLPSPTVIFPISLSMTATTRQSVR